MATDRQIAFAQSLIQDRDIPSVTRDIYGSIEVADLDTRSASRLIDELLQFPKRAPQAAPQPLHDVPAGRYAIEENGALHFFRVDRPTEGKWAGRLFLSEVVGGRDRGYPVRDDRKARVLATISADAQGALLRFGQEIGVCGHCGRTLTDAESRAAGIGPVCAGRRAA